MPNLTCDEGGVLKEVDLFWEREIDDDTCTFKMKKCLSNLKKIDSNVINIITMS